VTPNTPPKIRSLRQIRNNTSGCSSSGRCKRLRGERGVVSVTPSYGWDDESKAGPVEVGLLFMMLADYSDRPHCYARAQFFVSCLSSILWITK